MHSSDRDRSGRGHVVSAWCDVHDQAVMDPCERLLLSIFQA
jgi:hypothetical protein